MTRGASACAFTLALSLAAVAASSAQSLSLSPQLPSTADRIEVHYISCGTNAVDPPEISGQLVRIIDLGPCLPPPAGEPVSVVVTLPALAAGAYTLQLEDSSHNILSRLNFTVSPVTTTLSLLDFLFVVGLERTGPGGANLPADAVQLSNQSGYFWFFGSSVVEVTVKILDGRLINGHYWVFVASMTDQAFTLTVTSNKCPPGVPPSCPSKSYKSAAGRNTNFIDVEAFSSP
jgi:hypothetical protein